MLGSFAAAGLAVAMFGQAALAKVAYDLAASHVGDPDATPEPGTMALFGMGLIGIGMVGRLKHANRKDINL